MSFNKLYVALVALLVVSNYIVDGKKVKKNKRPKEQDEYTTLQPNVVAYSTFGFNDVGGYDGFIPTSPEHASFLSGGKQESTTRLYAPAFPSAPDSTGYSGNFGTSSSDSSAYGANEESVLQTGMSQYAPNSYINTPNFGVNGEYNKHTEQDELRNHNTKESDAPIYGAKISSRHKNSSPNQYNTTDFGAFGNSGDYDGAESTHDTNPYGGPSINFQNTNGYSPNYRPHEPEEFGKPTTSISHNVVNFPRVVDFTNINQHYPSELDTTKLMLHSSDKPLNTYNYVTKPQDDRVFDSEFNFYNSNKKPVDTLSTQSHFTVKPEDANDVSTLKTNSFPSQSFNYNLQHKPYSSSTKSTEQKKKIKHKPLLSGNYSTDYRDWKDSSNMKGYGYSTNYSSMNFKYDVSESKSPFNFDEIEPASSNIVDLTNYKLPQSDYTSFKQMPQFDINDDDEIYPNNVLSYKNKLKSHDYVNKLKNSFNSISTTTTPYWGSFKESDYSLFKDPPKKNHYSDFDHDDIVTIPKRPKWSFTKPEVLENKEVDWPYTQYRPHKLNKHNYDWTKEVTDTKYKSEEDLLGLRTHDTSHPSYLPSFQPTNSVHDNDKDFKKLVEKWRQSYMKSKYRDAPVRDYESYGSEVKPMHVPIPKPYPIEVPHPVIVPVPRPFPVHVPVSRPVAVPVIRELTVPIEKPVPYPVIKKVPFPVEKLVPVPVEKEVAVPVEKPYPVHIPHVRPVFHYTRPHSDRDLDHNDDDDFQRRPEPKKPLQYKKRPYGTRNRTQRPSRQSYQDRNRRRWPDRRRPVPQSSSTSNHRYPSRPNSHPPPYKHRDYEPDAEEDDSSDYTQYCRRTGKC